MSTTRCQTGDLVIIVNTAGDPYALPLLGQIRKVTEALPALGGGVAWRYEGEPLCMSDGKPAETIPDIAARPIRPGDLQISCLEILELTA